MLSVQSSEKSLARGLLDVLIRAGLVIVLAIFCFRIVVPFLNLLVWSLILAITLHPLLVRLRGKSGRHSGLIATLIILAAFAIILVPTYMLGVAAADSVDNVTAIVKSGGFRIPPPSGSVAGWPLVGQRLYDFWMQASTDLTGLAHRFAPQIKDAGLVVLGTVAGLEVGLVTFVAALILAGVFMAHSETGHRSALLIASRISGPDNGPKITELCIATIRAVAQGVVGIAFIQMLLIGIGFVLKGIPGAGLLALAVLLLGIMQLPSTIITVPVIIFVFATDGASAATIIFAIYTFVAGLADNVLKPLMLGRGVDVPMPVVLLGALGGMITSGVIGLFIGPVMLAVGYQLFWRWVEDQPAGEPAGAQGEP